MKAAVGCLLVVLLVVGLVAFTVYGSYNGLVGAEEGVTTAAEVRRVFGLFDRTHNPSDDKER